MIVFCSGGRLQPSNVLKLNTIAEILARNDVIAYLKSHVGSAGTPADHLSTRSNRCGSYTANAELSPCLPTRRHVFLHAGDVSPGTIPLWQPGPGRCSAGRSTRAGRWRRSRLMRLCCSPIISTRSGLQPDQARAGRMRARLAVVESFTGSCGQARTTPAGVARATATRWRYRTSTDWTPRALNCHSVNDVFGRVKNGPQEYLRTLHDRRYRNNLTQLVTTITLHCIRFFPDRWLGRGCGWA